MNKNKLLKILIALSTFVLLFFGVKELTKPKIVEGIKTVEIIIIDYTGDEKVTIHQKTYQTNTELLSDFLIELNEKEELSLQLQGNRNDPYGRSIVMINGLETTDWNAGPWWTYESNTNQDCLSVGFCGGIDTVPIYDNDVFYFTFTSTFE